MCVFQIKKNPSGRYYFVFLEEMHVKEKEGFYIVSKSYTDRALLEDSIVQLRKFSDISEIITDENKLRYPCFFVKQDSCHQFYFHAFGIKGDLVMTSMSFQSRQACHKGIHMIKMKSKESRIIDLT
ncbi:hypothetical protein [Anoxynatronum sibiricum]|uniref:DUF1508 domain-containing protein n=1 Tax=Anoxynatronum sibiricum TaxID=210623 RepID=A0ABU9VU48_9CLOT